MDASFSDQAGFAELVRRRLAELPPQEVDGQGLRRAAVLLPLIVERESPLLLFTVRTEEMPTHKGQVSFPGGGVKAGDKDLRATALRETHEEIGVEPAEVEVLGRMDALRTASVFVVTPFVGIIPGGRAHVRSDREVARLLQIPLRHLLAPASRYPDPQTGHWRYPWDGQEIWGATARMLSQFLGLFGPDPRLS